MGGDIFLSYADKDEEHARKFDKWLRGTFALECFLAAEDAGSGNKGWLDNIVRALRACKVAVVLVTSRSMNSQWVNFEVGFCHAIDTKVFPIVLRECDEEILKEKVLRTAWPSEHYIWSKDRAKTLVKDLVAYLKTKKVNVTPRDPEVDFCLGTLESVGLNTERDLIDELYRSRPLANQPKVKEYFLSKHELDIAPILIDPFVVEYCAAVESAKSTDGTTIALPTQHRVVAAQRLLGKAKESVCAISVVENDPWLNSKNINDSYLVANYNAGKRLKDKRAVRLGGLKRLFVCQFDDFYKSITPKMIKVIQKMKESDIELKWISYTEVREFQKRRGVHIENLLVVDNHWMTESSGEGHKGNYSIAPKKIDDNIGHFFDLWEAADPLPHLPESSELTDNEH